MPDPPLPEPHLPDVKLPDGLRDMNRQDIQAAIGDRMPRKIEFRDVDLSKIDLSKIALSKVELPKSLEDRLPRRKRTNPILPIAAVVAIGSLIAAAWWLITTPMATLKVRKTADRLMARVTGAETGVERYDDDANLGSLLPDSDQSRPSIENETWPGTTTDLGGTIAPRNGV